MKISIHGMHHLLMLSTLLRGLWIVLYRQNETLALCSIDTEKMDINSNNGNMYWILKTSRKTESCLIPYIKRNLKISLNTVNVENLDS